VGNVDGPQSAVANKIQPPYLRTHERWKRSWRNLTSK
jgi:hypothetical protein